MRIMAIALAMVAAFAMTASAADWNFYGSARVSTFVKDTESKDVNFEEDFAGNSRIGAKVKVSDELSARFEYGASEGKANVRELYGAWNFGAGELIVGKTVAPAWLSVSNQAYASSNGLGGWGENFTCRTAQLQLKFDGLQIAILKANANYLIGTDAKDDVSEVNLPGVQVKYAQAFGNFDFAVSAAGQTFEIGTEDVDSYMVAAKVGAAFGPAYVKAPAFMGENMGNIAETNVIGDADSDNGKGYAVYNATTKKVTDVEAKGCAIAAGYTVNDMVSLEAGFGYAETKEDGAADENEVISYYVQAPITLASGVFIVPEVGVVDYVDGTEADVTYYGAKWQINF